MMGVWFLAAAVSFATGTSWGTMAILVPLVYPLGHQLPVDAGLAAGTAINIHLAAVSAVLAGAVFGDHCSPISDTTILSSMASGCDHVDHVRTQLPYALFAAAVALVVGAVTHSVTHLNSAILMPVGLAVIFAWVWVVGRSVDEPASGA